MVISMVDKIVNNQLNKIFQSNYKEENLAYSVSYRLDFDGRKFSYPSSRNQLNETHQLQNTTIELMLKQYRQQIQSSQLRSRVLEIE